MKKVSKRRHTPAEMINLLLECARVALQGWCKYDLARGRDGKVVDPTDPGAVKRCLSGVMLVVGGDANTADDIYGEVYKQIKLDPGSKSLGLGVAHWNDCICRSARQAAALFRKTARKVAAENNIEYPCKRVRKRRLCQLLSQTSPRP
jgi:hypothetical protein